jgi:Peptidase family M28
VMEDRIGPFIEDVAGLAAIRRPSASAGERRSAEWLRERLRQIGIEGRIEEESAHGTLWWPLGLLNAAGLAASAWVLRGRRTPPALLGLTAAMLLHDDVSGGRLWFRRVLPRRKTYNVIAELGDPAAQHTVVLSAHHDAAHGGLIFSHDAQRALFGRFPALLDRLNTAPPMMWLVIAGPLLAGAAGLIGSRRLARRAAALCVGVIAFMLDIGLREVVPGANDNASAVAATLGVARALTERPADGVRVLLVFPGSEESFLEGMQAFGRRHFDALDRERTLFLNFESVGSPELVLMEGEGMLRMFDYTPALKQLVAELAERDGIALRRGQRTRSATDALIPLRGGFSAMSLVSIEWYKLPSNYHLSSDTAENVNHDSVARAAALGEALVRELAANPERWPRADRP